MSLLAHIGRTGAKRLVRACIVSPRLPQVGPPTLAKETAHAPRSSPCPQAPASARALSQSEQFRQFAAAPAAPAAQGECRQLAPAAAGCLRLCSRHGCHGCGHPDASSSLC